MEMVSASENQPGPSSSPGESDGDATAFQSTSSARPELRGPNKTAKINESMISLLLRLHAKYSEKPDSYIPIDKRSGMSVEKDYRESRIGDACFFIEKLLDNIFELDEACALSIENCRKTVWPHYHEEKARLDAERELREAAEKKKKAKERQANMLAQLASQRKRFMATQMDSEEVPMGESAEVESAAAAPPVAPSAAVAAAPLADPVPAAASVPSTSSSTQTLEAAGEPGDTAPQPGTSDPNKEGVTVGDVAAAEGGSGKEASAQEGEAAKLADKEETSDIQCCHCRMVQGSTESLPLGVMCLVQVSRRNLL